MTILKNKSVLLLTCVLAALGLIAPTVAAADGTPDISLVKNAPETGLLGTTQKVQLVAENQAGPERGYNLTFRDALPKGVAYVPGSSTKVTPRVLDDQPAIGMTTLIFENVSDLSVGSHYALSYEVEPLPTVFKITGEHVYTNKAEAFVSKFPRIQPRFNANGEVIPLSFSGNDTDEATTELTAIEIEKSEPSPEDEILRGVHEHQTVYTLTVRNNKVGPTQGVAGVGPGGKPAIVIEDWLPAGLEFLGCGNVDNTTETSTNPGSAEEYPGSGPIDPGNAPTTTNCVEPFYVQTEEVEPPGGNQPSGVYTHVKFLGPESLPIGGKYEMQYVAAVPIRQNSLTWNGVDGEPSATSLGQIANLDNNNGPETVDEEELTNVAQAHGEYEAVPVRDTDEMTRAAEDLAIQKSVDQPEIYDGAQSVWSLHLEASEYRRVEPVSITDQLPDGLCPLGPQNYEGPAGGPITEPKAECEPSASHPIVKYLKGGPAGKAGTQEQIEYSLAEEEAGGGFKLEFNAPDVEALRRLEPSQELLLTFPTATRVYYQEGFKDANPVLTGDSWTNEVTTEGPDYARCFVEEAGVVSADPNCEADDATPIFTQEPEGTPDHDASSAGQQAAGLEIEKTVRKNLPGLVPAQCTDPISDYVKGLVSADEPTLPQYRPGDEVCWRLVVKFASNLYAGTPVVTDFIPPDHTYVQGSAVKGPENTVEAEFDDTEGALEWKVGDPGAETVQNEQTFEWRFKTKVDASSQNEPGEITGNLMKFLYSNTAGETFPLRDRAEVERLEPELSLEKAITGVGGKTVPKPAPGGKSSVIAGGGEVVQYELDLENAGNLDAEEAEVWDVLPDGIGCDAVTLPTQAAPQAAECDAATGTIKWTGVKVAKGALTALTYEVTVPTEVAPGHAFVNHAGVTRYRSLTNTPEKFEYIPEDNINEELTESNTGPLLDEAEVKTTAATLDKEATTETEQPGNNAADQATIGEVIDYKVTATVPANSKLYGLPVLKDVLPANLEKVGAATAKLDGATLPAGKVTLEQLANGAEVRFNGAFPEAVGSQEHTVVMTFKARVLNLAVNHRGVTITNKASFEFEDVEEAGTRRLEDSIGTQVVEPRLEVKKNLMPAGRDTVVAPGEVVEYETEVSNLAGPGSSTANEVTVIDTVPDGMEILDAGSGTPAGNQITWQIPVIAPGETKGLAYKLKVIKPATAASSFTNVVLGETQSLPNEPGGATPPDTRDATSGVEGYESEDENTVRLIGATVWKEVAPTEGTIGTDLTYKLHMLLPPDISYYDTTMVDQLPEGIVYDGEIAAECVKGCGVTVEGEELTDPADSSLLGWYFGDLAAGPERELVVEFKAHIDDVKSGGGKVEAPETLTNVVVGLYNEEPGGKPTEVPKPGSNDFSEQTEEAKATTKVLEPKVTLTKGVTAVPALVGEIATQPDSKLTYTLTVGNTGTSNAYDVEVVDTNTTGNLRDIVPVTGAEYVKPAAGPLVWVLPVVEPGKPVTLTYTAELAPSAELEEDEEVKNAAEVPSYFGLTEEERDDAKVSREYEGPRAGKNLEVTLPKIRVEKTTGVAGFPDVAAAEVGKPFPWRVVVKNESATADAKAVAVEDVLPPNWTYVPGSTEFKALGSATVEPASDPVVTGAGTQTLTWANVSASLPHTASVEVLFKATPTLAAVTNPGAPVNENTATGTSEDLSGATESADGPYSDEDEATAELLAPKLAIEKTPDGATTVAGSSDKYEIKVSNTGTGAAHEVEVTDVLSAGQTFVGPATASPPDGFAQKSVEEDTPGPGETTVVWTLAEVPANDGANDGEVTITVPIKTLSSLNEGDGVSDLATVRSPQQSEEPDDEGSFVVHREADLSVVKKAAEQTVNAGEEIHYELVVENHGPSDATGIVVTDELPDNTVFKGSDPECAEAGGTVTCELDEMKATDPPQSHTFKFTVEIESGTTGSIENTAEVHGDQDDPEPTNDTSTVTTPISGLAHLAIEKTGPEKPVLLGNQFTYEIKVENEGPSDAVNTTVEDKLPSQVKFVSATPSVGTCDDAPAAILTCDLGTLLPHKDTTTIVVTVEAVEVGGFENFATVESDTSPEPEEDEAHAEIVPAADLTIVKTAPATVEPDGTLTYALQVENHGPSVAHQVTVTDPLPAGVDFVSADDGCAAAGTTVTCAVAGELAVGDSAEFEVTVHVPFALGGQSLTNTATVAGEEGDPHPEDNTSTVTTDVGPAADLAIAKTMGKAEAGKPLTYTLAVTNHGPSASSAVTVTDTLPAGTGFKSAAPSQGTCSAAGQTVTCQLGKLAAGGSAQVSITVEVEATVTGSLRNVAAVEGPEPDPDKSNNQSAVEGPVTPVPPATPNLKVVKTTDTKAPAVGVPFAYQVAITNVSDVEAKNVKVIDTLSGPVKVVSIETEAGHCGAAGSKITCTIPSIPAGKTVRVTYSVVAEAVGSLKNTVSAQAANGEKAPGDNHAVKGVQVKDLPASYKLTKSASRKVVAGGRTVGFTITLRNGAAALVNAKVCDRLPAALVFVKAAGSRYVNGEACWTAKYVAPRKVLRLHLVARAVKGRARQVRNVATASADNAKRRSAAATVRVKAAFAGKPGGVTG